MAKSKAPTENETTDLDVAPEGDDEVEAISATDGEVAPTVEETPPPDAWSPADPDAGPEQAAQQNADSLEEAMALQDRLAREAAGTTDVEGQDMPLGDEAQAEA